ncbi:unnamed protein product [Meganyctiphanes norvegica]|uniref:C2H2-type domain-containing protein n=1 Tax=Meganyctiphanes norvegica TaxID=48144 RepID=A0AAV2SLP4_MEGNR
MSHSAEKFEAPLFSCSSCGYKTRWKYFLKFHMIIHSFHKSEPFLCTECNFRCTTLDQLEKHMRYHSEKKPFANSDSEYGCAELASDNESSRYLVTCNQLKKVLLVFSIITAIALVILIRHLVSHDHSTSDVEPAAYYRGRFWLPAHVEHLNDTLHPVPTETSNNISVDKVHDSNDSLLSIVNVKTNEPIVYPFNTENEQTLKANKSHQSLKYVANEKIHIENENFYYSTKDSLSNVLDNINRIKVSNVKLDLFKNYIFNNTL